VVSAGEKGAGATGWREKRALTLTVGLVAIACAAWSVVPVDAVLLNSIVQDGDDDPELSTHAAKMSANVLSRYRASQLTSGDPGEQFGGLQL